MVLLQYPSKFLSSCRRLYYHHSTLYDPYLILLQSWLYLRNSLSFVVNHRKLYRIELSSRQKSEAEIFYKKFSLNVLPRKPTMWYFLNSQGQSF